MVYITGTFHPAKDGKTNLFQLGEGGREIERDKNMEGARFFLMKSKKRFPRLDGWLNNMQMDRQVKILYCKTD